MTTLTKIGNSQGIRIPKPLIEQAHLENVNLELEVLENGLLIKPVNNTDRSSWKENIEKVSSAIQKTRLCIVVSPNEMNVLKTVKYL
jgi:antitoxin MazE